MYPTMLLPNPELLIARPTQAGYVYWVDSENGDNNNEGMSPNSAFATIQTAVTASNATVAWSPNSDVFNYIMVLPGNNYAENLTPWYWAYMVGLGMRGTDTSTEIHTATGDCVAGTLLGTGLINLRLEVDAQDACCIDAGICNNSWFEHCQFVLGANVTGVVGIDTENCTHLTVRKCDFQSGQLQEMAYAIYARGGSDKFFHNCRIEENNIFAKTMGIYMDYLCTADRTIIKHNVINVSTTGTGIDGFGGGADTGGGALAVKNYIIIDGAGDAIHGLAAGKKLHNETNVNGTFAYETA